MRSKPNHNNQKMKTYMARDENSQGEAIIREIESDLREMEIEEMKNFWVQGRIAALDIEMAAAAHLRVLRSDEKEDEIFGNFLQEMIFGLQEREIKKLEALWNDGAADMNMAAIAYSHQK